MFKVNRYECISCGACEEECPEKAIVLDDDGAKINKQICGNCGNCMDICPVEAIEEKKDKVKKK